MSFSIGKLGLYTDLYELTMAQGYFLHGKKNQGTCFDYFYRTNPFNNGFAVFAGLNDFLELLQDFTFSKDDISYLKGLGFHPVFLSYLATFSFKGDIYSVDEGEIVFPNEPLVRVEGNIIECQLIESLLLNILNFETLIATKAFRIKQASGKAIFADFGLRRAQGLGAIHASRAAIIGGAASTSNVLAGKLFDIPVTGTMAHSWIQTFEDELTAFRVYANNNLGNITLLVDTYDTLKSGVPNAIKVAEELKGNGKKINAIRLDSGDLAYLSKKARAMLNQAGFPEIKIVASNQLNEHVINSLVKEQQAPIDIFGVGTELTTAKPDAALDGVYKLASIDKNPKMKISENSEKTTLPGTKNLVRYFDHSGNFYCDAIHLSHESPEKLETIYHPANPNKSTQMAGYSFEVLLKKVCSQKKIILEKQNPMDIFAYLNNRINLLPEEHKRFVSPHIYKVGISKLLLGLRNELLAQHKVQ